jgi:hypothetical protein
MSWNIKATKYCEQCKAFKEDVKSCHKCKLKYCVSHLVFYKIGNNGRELKICANCKEKLNATNPQD